MEDGGIGWWEEYEVLKKKYELCSEYRSVCSWKEKIKIRNVKDWEEEVSSKSILKWYKLAEKSAEVEMYLRSAGLGSYEGAVQTEDWLSWVVGG